MDDNRNQVASLFDEIAWQYDSQRRKLIPCFDDFYQVAASVAQTGNDSPHILDLGAGTGLFSAFLVNKYPKASFTLMDLSENMLEVAKQRFKNRPGMQYLAADYTTYAFDQSFDIIVSSLSIHHLEDAEKKRLYQTVFSLLKENGVFVNADQVLGSTAFLDSLYKNDWKQKVESSGLSLQEIQAAYERTKLDRMATLDIQLQWLNEIGFSDVDCIYKYHNFVVLFGRKLPRLPQGSHTNRL